MRSGSVPSARAIPMVWVERPGWRSMSTIFELVVTEGSFQRLGAPRRWRTPPDETIGRLYGGECRSEARAGAHMRTCPAVHDATGSGPETLGAGGIDQGAKKT